jgi:copper(I)-binding protein
MLALTIALAAQVTLDNRIVRAAPAGGDAAAYVAIGNAGEADRLVGVSCACAGKVEIHRVTRREGSVSMTAEPALPVPGGGVEIRPGSPLHLMLMNLRAPIAAGETVLLTLRFARAGAVTAAFTATEDTAAAWQGPAASAAPAPTVAAELQPLAFLVGSCWRATFPNSTSTDTHCYTPMLGGRYIRDIHIVEGAPAPYGGETIFRWDTRARRIRYDYYASDGGTSGGFADPTATGIDFPEETYVGGNGQTMTLRTVQTGNGGETYARTTSARQPDGSWREMWTMRFTRVGPATAPR